MSAAIAPYYSPVLRNSGLERLAVFDVRGDPPIDWAEVHDQVQRALVPLESAVRERLAGVQTKSSSTKGTNYWLFSYRTFYLPGADLDPVVAGITFTPGEKNQVAIEADVGGEHSGDEVVAPIRKNVVSSHGAVLRTARAMIESLCETGDAIVAALKDSKRKLE